MCSVLTELWPWLVRHGFRPLLLDRIGLVVHVSNCSKIGIVYNLLFLSAQFEDSTHIPTGGQQFLPSASQDEVLSPLNTDSSLHACDIYGSASCL